MMYKARILNNSEFGGIYSNEFLESNQENEINGDLVSNWITTEVLPNNLLKPILNSSEWIEGLTVEEVKTYKNEKETQKEFNCYLRRKSDGENAYLKLSAEFRLAKLSGQISEETHSYLEELLTPVRNEIMFGQWKKALDILENLGVEQIGADLYNRLYTQISLYINDNY